MSMIISRLFFVLLGVDSGVTQDFMLDSNLSNGVMPFLTDDSCLWGV